VSAVANEEIKEVQRAKFVSVMLDETSDIQRKSKFSTVLRYLSERKICERLSGFIDVSCDRKSGCLFQHVQQVISESERDKKLVDQIFDEFL
jgi:hypothetical protein